LHDLCPCIIIFQATSNSLLYSIGDTLSSTFTQAFHNFDADPVSLRTRSHIGAPSLKASDRRLVGILKTAKGPRGRRTWAQQAVEWTKWLVSGAFASKVYEHLPGEEVVEELKAGRDWRRVLKWLLIGLPLALFLLYLLSHAWLLAVRDQRDEGGRWGRPFERLEV
jgi:hypothetical protein